VLSIEVHGCDVRDNMQKWSEALGLFKAFSLKNLIGESVE
jgi:hypothetical protein